MPQEAAQEMAKRQKKEKRKKKIQGKGLSHLTDTDLTCSVPITGLPELMMKRWYWEAALVFASSRISDPKEACTLSLSF